MPDDLTEAFVTSLELLMLAQAQECVWQKAVLGRHPVSSNASPAHVCIDNYKNGIVAKLSMKVTAKVSIDKLPFPHSVHRFLRTMESHWRPLGAHLHLSAIYSLL